MKTKAIKRDSFPFIIIFFFIFSAGSVFAQPRYVPPEDPLVEKNLEEWQNLKFGFMMHWGPYSQWGVVEPGLFVQKMFPGVSEKWTIMLVM